MAGGEGRRTKNPYNIILFNLHNKLQVRPILQKEKLRLQKNDLLEITEPVDLIGGVSFI